MTMKKIVVPGFIAGVAMLVAWIVVNWVLGFTVPSLASQYQNPALFRPWSDPLMNLIFLQPFVLGIILAWVWGKTKGLFTERDVWKRGLNFGIAYWIITIPGMFISYSTFPVSLVMVISWSLSGFVQAVVAGWVFAKKLK